MNKTILRKYARLIAAVGANVQKGQEVFITAGLDQPEFVAMVVEACYPLRRGAGGGGLGLSAAGEAARAPPVPAHPL